MSTIKAAIWLRVSTSGQDEANQLPDIERLAAQRGFEITHRYELRQSAWSDNAAYKAELERMLTAAHRGEFDVLIVWALDRLSRQGIEPTLRVIRKLDQASVTLISVQEPWLSGSPETQELMVSIFAWVAKQESARRSARVKAGIERRRKEGLPVGRQTGATDKPGKRRNKSGYHAAWEGPEGDARKAALAERNRDNAAKQRARKQSTVVAEP